VNPKKMWEALESLPEDLNAAYDDVIVRIKERDPEGNALAVLSWIYRAYRPLTMKELREALSVSPGQKTFNEALLPDAQKLIEICEGLVICVPVGTFQFEHFPVLSAFCTVQFAHFTVQEFLQLHCNSQLLPHAEIAMTCWTYLGFEELVCSAYTAGWAGRFGCYATRYCVDHTRGEAENDPEIQKVFLSYFENKNKRRERLHLALGRSGYYIYAEQTLLHVFAFLGLATLCSLALEPSFSQKK
jgi:hypothetical protein